MTWIISALVILGIIVMMMCNEKFAEVVGLIFRLGTILLVFILLTHLIYMFLFG